LRARRRVVIQQKRSGSRTGSGGSECELDTARVIRLNDAATRVADDLKVSGIGAGDRCMRKGYRLRAVVVNVDGGLTDVARAERPTSV
jgi:hypothetical protein